MQITTTLLDARTSDLEKDRDRMMETIYTGNGKPAILETLAVHDKAIAALTHVAWLILTAVVGVLVTSIASLILIHGK